MFDTVKDRIVLLTEDQVAVFSHDLHNQLLAADIAEFVQMLELKNKNTLESRLGNGENAGAADVALSPGEVKALDDALDTMEMSAVFGGTSLPKR